MPALEGLAFVKTVAYSCVTMAFENQSFLPLGDHLVQVDGDSVFLVAHGVLTADDMLQLLRLYREVRDRHGGIFALYDARMGTGLDPAARKLVTGESAFEFRANLHVAFGASFPVRVLVTMVYRAQTLLGRKTTPMHMLESEAEARAVFESERARLRAALALTNSTAP